MVLFNDLRISDDGSCLVIDCRVEDIGGYEGMYIDTIHVDYYKNVTDFGIPSDKAIKVYEKPANSNGEVAVRVTVLKSGLPDTFGTKEFLGGLFFVTVACDGTPRNASVLASSPCGFDNTVDVGVILDWSVIYRNGMAYASKLAYGCGDPCDIPGGFESFILYWNALRLAIETCDWPLVVRLWDKVIGAAGGSSARLPAGCGCRG